MLLKLLVTALLLPASVFAADGRPEVVLWTGGAPGSAGITAKEIYEPPNQERNYSRLTNVHQPSLVVYLPPKERATGSAVIICPGGAHRFLAIDHEGYDIAKWFNTIGVGGFVLKYRLARTEGHSYPGNRRAKWAHLGG